MKHVILSILLLVTLCGCGVDWFPLNEPEITTNALPVAAVNVSYNQTIAVTGGTSPLSFALLSGKLPTGLSLSTGGVISGTPTETGSFTFSVIVMDAAQLNSTHTYTIVVVQAITLPLTTVGAKYNTQVPGTGAGSGVTCQLATGKLPDGLNLSSDGVISGTATTAGDFLFSLILTSSTGSATRFYSIHVNAGTSGSSLSITTTSLPAAKVGSAYRQVVSATGGTAPYTWSSTGALPAGLAFRPISSAQYVAGTPTAAGTSTFTVKATDSSQTAQTASQQLSLTVNP